MSNAFRTLDVDYDPGVLLARIQPEMWEADTRRQDAPGSPHKETQCIIIRGPALEPGEDPVEAAHRNLITIDWPLAEALMPQVGEAVMAVLLAVAPIVRLGRVMIVKLAPLGTITPHVDEGLYADCFDRFILCLDGDGGNIFECAGVPYHPTPRHAFWFNHKLEHRAHNSSAEPRIHLVVDAMAPRFTRLRGVTYQAERVSDLWDEITPLLEAHWKEIAHYQDIKLEPDQDAYAALEARGQLRCYTARDNRKLIGYVVFMVRPNIHYKSSLQALQDVLFLAPEYRRGRIGVKLIELAERRLKAEGVQAVYHHVKRTNQVGRLLALLGYELVDEVYAKRLDTGE